MRHLNLIILLCSVIAARGEVAPLDGAVSAIDGVAAYVNDKVITVGEILAFMEPARRQLVQKYSGAELETKMEAVFDSSLNSLMDRQLILAAYAKSGISIPDAEIENRIRNFVRRTFGSDRSALMEALAADNLTYDEWKSQMRENIIISFMRERELQRGLWIPPGAMRKIYEANVEKYRAGEKVKLRMIVLDKGGSEQNAAAKREEAKSVRQRLIEGADFAALAKEVSTGTKASEGGDWGWIEPRTLRQELSQAAATLQPPAISDVIETKDQLYILKAEARQDAAILPFETVEKNILREFRKEKEDQIYRGWIVRLKNIAYVKTFDISSFHAASQTTPGVRP